MDTDLDSVLRRVAAGELTPEDALRVLQPVPEPVAAGAVSGAQPTTTSGPLYGTPTSAPAESAAVQDRPSDRMDPAGSAAGPVSGLRIRAAYRSVEVIADSSVQEAFVSGQHVMHREGSVLVAEASDGPPIFGDGASEDGQRFSFAALPRTLAWARSWRDHQFAVRVNPMLPVELDVVGCAVRLSGLEAGARIRLVASSLKTERVRGPLDIDALSSSLKGSLGPSGRSRLVAESASVKVNLLAGSGLRVSASNRMSKIVLPSVVAKPGRDHETLQATIGDGEGELLIEALMSSIAIDGPH